MMMMMMRSALGAVGMGDCGSPCRELVCMICEEREWLEGALRDEALP